MKVSMLLRFGVFSCASLFTAVSCSDQTPLVNGAARPITAADPEVVKHYRSNFHRQLHTRSIEIPLHPLCWGCTIRGACCPTGGPLVPPPKTASEATSTMQSTPDSGTVTVVVTVTQSTPHLPFPTPWEPFPLPVTLSKQSATRTTLFRNPTDSAESNVLREEHVERDTARQPNDNKDDQDLEEITSSYYDYTLDGHHPFEVPLIVLDNDQTPVTLFAFANISQELSFISYDLLNQIGRTSEIINKNKGLESGMISDMLGFRTSSLGTISLDTIAGKNDKHFKSLEFTVFESNNEVEGELRMDLSVGLGFLRDANAIQLTNEFVGTGAKEGLGIVLQRVYQGKNPGEAQRLRHEEL